MATQRNAIGIHCATVVAGALLALAGIGNAGAGEMAELSETDLSGVAGQAGIAMNVEWAINASASGSTVTPVACPTSAMHANGTPECRIALEFADRAGIWLVMKNYYGLVRLNKVWVDAARTRSTASGYSNAASVARFPVAFNPNNLPAVQLSYDHSALAATTSFYGDAEMFLNVGRLTAEFDCAPSGAPVVCGTATPGYLRDAVTGTPLSLRVADGANGTAQIRFDGKMQMYGF